MARAAHDGPGARLHRAALWLAYRVLLVVWFLLRPHRSGVFVAVWCGGRLLAVRNSYRDGLSLPAGGVKRREAPLHAAVRELGEEVGLVAAPEALRFACEVPSRYEFKRDRCAFYELELSAPPALALDGREVVWAGFVDTEATSADAWLPPVRSYLALRAARYAPSRSRETSAP
jgi:8-oxo-dGTP pyrophosphatase MutT (NUDIX family)